MKPRTPPLAASASPLTAKPASFSANPETPKPPPGLGLSPPLAPRLDSPLAARLSAKTAAPKLGAVIKRLVPAVLIIALAPFWGCSWVAGPPDTADPANPDMVIAELKPDGEAQFLARDYKRARAPLTAAARSGSLRGAYFLRILVESGLDGKNPDPDEAHRLLSLLAASERSLRGLAERGPAADKPIYQAALATLHLRGYLGAKPDPMAALYLAREAAEAGLAPARNLAAAAIMATEGASWLDKVLTGTKQEAWRHVRSAAEAGDVLAMGNASYLARNGLGTDIDPLLGASWARRCAALPEATDDA